MAASVILLSSSDLLASEAKSFFIADLLQIKQLHAGSFFASSWIGSKKKEKRFWQKNVFARKSAKLSPVVHLDFENFKNAEFSLKDQTIFLAGSKDQIFANQSSPFKKEEDFLSLEKPFLAFEKKNQKPSSGTKLVADSLDHVAIRVEDEFGVSTLVPQKPAAALEALIQEQDLEDTSSEALEDNTYTSNKELHIGANLFSSKKTLDELKQQLSFASVDQSLKIIFEDKNFKDSLAIFVKDSSILAWDEASTSFVAKQKGQTEVFFTFNKNLLIVPSFVEGKPFSLSYDTAVVLSALNSEVVPQAQSLDLLSTQEVKTTFVHADFDEQLVKEEQEARQLLNLQNLQSRLVKEEQRNIQVQGQVYRGRRSVASVPIMIQALEDSSYNTEDRVLPIPSLTVKVIGVGVETSTAASGLSQSFEVPAGSRLLVMIDDPLGRYQSASLEFDAPLIKESSGKIFTKKVHLMHRSTHQTFSRMALGIEEGKDEISGENDGSFCIAVKKPEFVSQIEDLTIRVDDPSARVLFFNAYGFVETEQEHIGPSGRVCVFGAAQGPLALQVLDIRSQQMLGQVPISVYADRHAYYELDLNQQRTLATTPLVSTSFEEQIMDQLAQNHYRATDWADLYPITSLGLSGSSVFLPNHFRQGYGLLGEHLLSFEGRSFYMVQAPEFEPTLYSLSDSQADQKDHGTVLLPSGFMNRAAAEAGSLWHNESSEGSLFIEHGRMLEETKTMGAVKIQVFDSLGQSISSAIVFADGGSGVTKALFANLNPGTYAITVTTEKGYWLASTTALVYSQVVSHIQTGSSVKSFFPEEEQDGI